MRADLTAVQQSYQGRDYWVVKDPLTLKYFRFEEEEFRLLKMLDGETSPDQIKRRFDYKFAPQKITMRELYQFVGMLFRSSLLVSDSPNQGIELKKRSDEAEAAGFKQKLTNILSIRFRGFDPDRMLTAMNPFTAWFFTWPTFIAMLLLGIGAASLIFAQFDTFQAKLPSFGEFFEAKNWFWLALVMALTKVAHEFGHGLACKRFGGQCHEAGVMLLVLTPCLYMNVSDSWLLKSKWQRAFIAAAGMYVELIIASFAVFIWWFSQLGMVNQLALNVIFVSSVSTLLFNANPLLRYDGYYILSDILEIPNLRSKATTILQRFFGRTLLGMEATPDPFLPRRHQWLFALYSVAAALYRWVITFSIFWFVYRVLEPYGFKVIGQMIAMMALYGLIGIPLVSAWKFFSVPGRWGAVKQARLAVSAMVLALIIGVILMIPIPHHVYCSFKIQLQDAANVYVDVPGMLAEIHAFPNQRDPVSKGQTLAVLRSPELDRQVTQLKTKVDMADTKFRLVKHAASSDGSRGEGARIAESAAALKTASRTFTQRQLDVGKLRIAAPFDGFLLAPPRREEKRTEGVLNLWDGIPLEAKNIGAWLDKKTVVAKIVPDMSKYKVTLAVDQTDIEFVQPTQSVELQLRQHPLKLYRSEIEEFVPVKMKETPRVLSSKNGGDIISTVNEEGQQVPVSTTYMLTVPMEIDDEIVIDGGTGVAKIYAGRQTVGKRIWRLLCHTFRFEL
jgi:putative peptide zinc metalloprotease protein